MVSVALDQREGLQHRVVDMGGDLGALLGSDEGATLLALLAEAAVDPGEHDDGDTAD
jgi:hypothetical protein